MIWYQITHDVLYVIKQENQIKLNQQQQQQVYDKFWLDFYLGIKKSNYILHLYVNHCMLSVIFDMTSRTHASNTNLVLLQEVLYTHACYFVFVAFTIF